MELQPRDQESERQGRGGPHPVRFESDTCFVDGRVCSQSRSRGDAPTVTSCWVDPEDAQRRRGCACALPDSLVGIELRKVPPREARAGACPRHPHWPLGAPAPQGRPFGGHKVSLLAHMEAQCEEVPEIGPRTNLKNE